MFARANNYLPPDLSVLPLREGYDNRITDGGGHEIIYRLGPDGIITLTTYGKDCRIGGTGDNADFIGVFDPRGPDGNWRDQVEWIHDPDEDFRASFGPRKNDR